MNSTFDHMSESKTFSKSSSNTLRRVVILFVIFMTLLSISACSNDPNPVPVDSPEEPGSLTMPSFTPETYPRVDGSTVTIPLSETIAAKMMNLTLEEVRPYILHNKTHQAYVNLIEKNADLIFVTSPSKEELAMAQDAGIALEVIPVVSEAFVFLVNSENTVSNLTQTQVQDIYNGNIQNWSEVGGENVPIIPFQRPVNSGSQTGFLDLVMKDITPMSPPMEQVIAEMGMLIDAVASFKNQPDAIGYSYYYFVMDMWGSEKIKLLSIDNVEPTPMTITSGKYPYTTAYYAVMRSDEPVDSAARQVVAWLLSDEGQVTAEETGYVRIH